MTHAFQKKSTQGIKTPKHEIDHPGQTKEIEGDAATKSGVIELVHGSGNVFRDFGHAAADVEQLKDILAAEIIKMMDDREDLTKSAVYARTGVAAADFSRIRRASRGRFTVDRFMSILNRLGSRVEVKVRVRTARAAQPATA